MYNAIFVAEWPWWVGGPLMGCFVLLYAWVYNRNVGMSSMVENAVRAPLEGLTSNGGEVVDAQTAAFLAVAEMGLSDEELREMEIDPEELRAAASQANAGGPARARGFELVPTAFLVGALFGAVATSVLAGGTWALTLGAEHARLLPWGIAVVVPVLFVAGLVGGFGARMAGGCPSGHGLAGLSLLSPGSLVALTAYFVTGVSLSFLLEWLV